MAPNDRVHTLLTEAQRGSNEAFDELVAVFETRIDSVITVRLGQRLKGQIEVEDIRQDTLLRAFRSIGQFRWQGEDSLMRWLGGIAEHVILYQKERLDRRAGVPLDRDLAADEITASRGLQREERFDRLKKAIDTLSPDHRQVILLARVERLPAREIARRMDRSTAAVAQLLSRALKSLRDSFGHTESLSLPDRGLYDGEQDDTQ